MKTITHLYIILSLFHVLCDVIMTQLNSEKRFLWVGERDRRSGSRFSAVHSEVRKEEDPFTCPLCCRLLTFLLRSGSCLPAFVDRIKQGLRKEPLSLDCEFPSSLSRAVCCVLAAGRSTRRPSKDKLNTAIISAHRYALER